MIYLDNAATTQIDKSVFAAMRPYLQEEYGNPGSLYTIGRNALNAIAIARKRVADMIGASPEQIIFTSGGTEANNLVFAGLQEAMRISGGRKIITTEIEHDSVVRPAKKLAEGYDWFDVIFARPVDGHAIRADDIAKLINHDTAFVSVMHTNNETGMKNEVEEIGRICKANDVLFHTDCVQAAGCCELDVDTLNCDFLSISSHKIHGPKGVGALYARNPQLLRPVIYGGGAQEFGLRGGTENVAGIVGFGKACQILTDNLKRNMQHNSLMRNDLYLEIMNQMDALGLGGVAHVNGLFDWTQPGKTLSIRFDGVDAETLLLMLDNNGICVSAGSACRSHESEPSRVLLAMGLEPEEARSSIRLSVSRYTTFDENAEAARTIASCVYALLEESKNQT